MIYLVIALAAALLVTCILLSKKHSLDRTHVQELADEISKQQNNLIQLTTQYEERKASYAQLRDAIEELKASRIKEVESAAEQRRAELNYELAAKRRESDQRIAIIEEQTQDAIQAAEESIAAIKQMVVDKQAEYESLIEPFKRIEQDQQDRLFYTIQVPEEYRPDIEFLLTTVAAKVNHPDIISKLVWQEYIKPYLDDTCKRVGIEADPGIYKITNITTNKCYIGKSTNIKKRIQDHMKSTVGITSIADQAIHHAMLDEGLWNWTFEVLCYCDKDELNEKEKFYINLFKSQEWGFNKREGG